MAKSRKKPAAPQFEVWVMAEGGPTDFYDAGMVKLKKSVARIEKILTTSGKLAVFSSGSEDSMDTAGRLIEDPWISARSVIKGVALGHRLAEDALRYEGKADHVVAQLGAFGSTVIAHARTVEHVGMVLVTGPEFITDLAAKTSLEYDGQADTTPFALNHFRLPIAPASS